MVNVRDMRRKDRALPREQALELLRRAEYGVLSSVGTDGRPYGVPLTFCVIGDAIYFHSALEGRKLDNVAATNGVSFCVVGDTEVLPGEFAIRYASAIVSGTCEEVFDADKQRGLEGLVSKYSPEFVARGLDYIEKHAAKVRVYRVRIETITGKARR